jgi:prepilin-type N-terminal cleavage/methylation domain-containing protein
MNIRKKIKAFTLAEVLITLLVIGIIASEVIPAVINNTKEVEFDTGLKKAYSDLSEATRMIQINNGGTIEVGTSSSSDATNTFRSEFCNVLSCVKTGTANNIFNSSKYKYYKGVDATLFNGSINASAVIKNGAFLRFLSYASCSLYGINACGSLIVDVNGNNPPNMFGRDLYQFFIVRNNGDGAYSIKSAGVQGDTYSALPNGCSSGSYSQDTSAGCTAKRLQDPNNMP